MKKRRQTNKKSFNRYTGIIIVMLIMFSGILAKLIYLQIVKADYYRDSATNKSVREIPEFAPRGEILDANGEKLTSNKISYMAVYNETDDTKKTFFPTMTTAFKILDELEKPKVGVAAKGDDFELKANPFSFAFRAIDDAGKNILEIRFKKDRGFEDIVKKKLGYNNKEQALTKDEQKKVDNELLNIKPEEVFNKLVKNYGLYKLLEDSNYTDKQILDFEIQMEKLSPAEIVKLLLKKYKVEDLRRYIIIKDTLKMNSYSGYKPVIIGSDISKETSVTFLQRLNEMPGIDVNTQPLREYPNGELGSAFLGYISKISSQPEKYEEKGYDVSTDYLGASGLEKAFEDRLKGSKGGSIVKLNRQGRVIEELGKRESYPGQNIGLTIKKNVQNAAEKALDQTMADLQAKPSHGDGTNTANATRGAAVVIDVNTGGIIALASRPGYDPNIFSTPGMLTPELQEKYFSPNLTAIGSQYITSRGLTKGSFQSTLDSLFKIDTSIKGRVVRSDYYDVLPKPLYNYATTGMSAPGSTFKPITAIAGLEEGKITPSSTITDLGLFKAYNANVACWKYIEQGGTHGAINVIKAIEVSCNYFFYEVSKRLIESKPFKRSANNYWDFEARDLLAQYAWKFGLGVNPRGKAKASTGIEIPENFGQTSNFESDSNLIIPLKIMEVNSLMKKSKLDIVVHESDSQAIKQAKTKLIDNCKQQMKFYDKSINNFSKEQVVLLKEIVYKTQEDAVKLTDADIDKVAANVVEIVREGNRKIINPSNIFQASIGQGFSQFTPLQLANYMATVVNGGKRYKLHLVDKFMDPNGAIIEQIKPEIIEDVKLKESTVEAIIKGMEKVTEDGGTATTAFENFPIKTGGKTGSATFNEYQHDFGREATGVYIGFAPLDKPQIAVCVVISDGAHGGYVAPVARSIYEAYFKDELLKSYPDYQFVYPYNK